MRNSHIDALQEIAGRRYPMEIRLKAGELLGMIVDLEVKKLDGEVTSSPPSNIPPRTYRDVASTPAM